MAITFVYEHLSAEDRLTLLRDKLRQLEADHFRIALEIQLAEVVGDADRINPPAQIELATLEAKMAAVRAWLDVGGPLDA
jgi:hypothetical protein